MIDWNGKQVVIIGAARQGTALARYLIRHGADVTISDQKRPDQLSDAITSLADLPVRWKLHGSPLALLDRCDLLCPSGGVPLELPVIVEAQRRSIPLSNDSQIFLEAAPCNVIGITGSAGKTTTTTLVGRIAEAATRHPASRLTNHFVGGNIGYPLIDVVDEMIASDVAVMELSSFQLEVMTRSPQVAAVTNITPNHLDRHGNMEAYAAAKARILHFQQADDVAILNREDPGSWALAEHVKGRLVSYGIHPLSTAPTERGPGLTPPPMPGQGECGTYLRDGMLCWLDGMGETPLVERSAIRLRGEHNLSNILGACAIAYAAGMPVEAIREGIAGFTGAAHRLEFVRRWGGAEWYNDSIATAPERAMADIRSFSEPLVMLVGGRDKHLPWDDFAALARQRVDHLVLFGEMAGLVQQALKEAGLGNYTLDVCKDLQAAVQTAAGLVSPGDVVLFAPGGTSFDEFRDFEERGEAFRRFVNALPS
ncbi:MAG: UDP-N-acetylmuramoyl-L-alanine--D-glutamate ligase [Chloroflexota bacterium]